VIWSSILAFAVGAFLSGLIVYFKLKAQAAAEKMQLQADTQSLTLKNELLQQTLQEQKDSQKQLRREIGEVHRSKS